MSAKQMMKRGFGLWLMCAAMACDDDRSSSNDEAEHAHGDRDHDADSKSDAGEKTDKDADVNPSESAIYMVQTAIYGTDETLNYTVLRHESDLGITREQLGGAREFPGYTGVDVIGDAVFAAAGDEPFIRKFSIGDDLSWKEEGTLNFGAYPMDEDNYMNFYFHAAKSDEVWYFYYGADKTSRVIWSPKDFKILGEREDTKLPAAAEGWSLENGGNRTGIRDFKGPVVQPFSMSNDETGEVKPTSWLAVYDESTHGEKAVLEVPCPGIQQATMDEQGDMYFATTSKLPTPKLYGKGPAPCVVKVKKDGTLDESFAPNDLSEWTGGYYGVNFRYLRDGKAVANVLRHDRLKDVDFGKDVDPKVVTQIEEDPKLWDLMLIDLKAGTAKEITGFKPEHDVAFYTTYVTLEKAVYILVQLDPSFKETRSGIYELNTDDGTVKYVTEAEGDIWGAARVR